jgi:hypothetical protein
MKWLILFWDPKDIILIDKDHFKNHKDQITTQKIITNYGDLLNAYSVGMDCFDHISLISDGYVLLDGLANQSFYAFLYKNSQPGHLGAGLYNDTISVPYLSGNGKKIFEEVVSKLTNTFHWDTK